MVFFQILVTRVVLEICVGNKPVVLPIGKAMTLIFCEHVSKYTNTQERIMMVFFVRIRELMRL